MWKRILLFIALSLLYIYILTWLFEYCINEASDTLRTVTGVVVCLALTVLYARFFYRNLKSVFKND